MKKKILLRTLIPLTTIGIGLGTALPLVSCSCSPNGNTIMTFETTTDFKNFAIPICNAALTTSDDANKDWSSKTTTDTDMIAWFNDKIDTQVMAFFLADEIPQSAFPIEYKYSNGIAQIRYYNLSMTFDISKISQTLFHFIKSAGGTIDEEYDFSIAGAGTYQNIRTISSSSESIRLRDSNYWPNVKFPTAAP